MTKASSSLVDFLTPPFMSDPAMPKDLLREYDRTVFNQGTEIFYTKGANLRMAYAEAPGSSELVVLLPGLGELAEKWSEEVERLKAQGKSVLVIEPRGIGMSTNSSLPGTIDLRKATEDFRELFASDKFEEFTRGKTVTLAGHSTGGHIALRYALQHTADYNKRFSGLMLLNPAVDLKHGFKGMGIMVGVLNRMGSGVITGLLSFKPKRDKDPASNDLTNDLHKLANSRTLQNHAFGRLFMGHARSRGTIGFAHHLNKSGDVVRKLADKYNERRAADRIKGLITIIYGEKDTLTPTDVTVDVGRKIGAELNCIPDARHEAHLDSGPVLDRFQLLVDRGLAAVRGTFAPR